jgi:endonuclease G, mitochondrial
MRRKHQIALCTFVVFFLTAGFLFAGPLEDCAEYASLGVPGDEGTLLCRKGHLLAHSPENKTPLWVIERLTADKAKGDPSIKREDFKFQHDPDLEDGRRAEPADYSKSGYAQGHMAPAADMRWNAKAMEECFYLSNMVPQVGSMNSGIWKSLETRVRKWSMNRGEVYIITGPIYESGTTQVIGKNKVGVPTHLYKIVYDASANEAIAFIMPNKPLYTKDMPKYIVTIRDVEEKTGLDFLSGLDEDKQDAVETKKAEAVWK